MFVTNLAVISLVFVPYFFILYMGHREDRKLLLLFRKEAKRNGLNIILKDRWNLNVIGIDQKQQKILFVQRRDEGYYIKVINLCSIKNCELFHDSKYFKINGGKELILQKIDLVLQPFNSDEKLVISLYDSDRTFEQDYELKHAEKWQRIINNNLSINPITRKAA